MTLCYREVRSGRIWNTESGSNRYRQRVVWRRDTSGYWSVSMSYFVSGYLVLVSCDVE